MLLKLAAEALGQPEIDKHKRENEGVTKSFWVVVLIDPPTRCIHSVHCCWDQTPNDPDRVWNLVKQEGWMRSVFVQAENIREALNKAFEKGILITC